MSIFTVSLFKKLSILKNIFIPFIILLLSFQNINSNACTIIVVGKNATADGSVIVPHTDAGSDCHVHVMPGQFFAEGDY